MLGPPRPRGREEAGAAAVGAALVGVGHLQGPGAGRQPPEPDQDSARPPPARPRGQPPGSFPWPGCPSHPLPLISRPRHDPTRQGAFPSSYICPHQGPPGLGLGWGRYPGAWSGPDLGPAGCSWGEAWGAPALGPGSLTSAWGSCPWGKPGTGHGSLGASGAPGPPARPGAAWSAGCPSGPWTADVTSFRSAGGWGGLCCGMARCPGREAMDAGQRQRGGRGAGLGPPTCGAAGGVPRHPPRAAPLQGPPRPIGAPTAPRGGPPAVLAPAPCTPRTQGPELGTGQTDWPHTGVRPPTLFQSQLGSRGEDAHSSPRETSEEARRPHQTA